MIPSLVAGRLQDALVEYLSTTFAIGDPATREALVDFFVDPVDGIFRGPYVDVRTPFRTVGEDWRPPLGWTPGFSPYLHQATAWERLSSDAHEPEPTIVTTGTGSGKTEAFLVPILDHCRRAVARDERGIKALVLYPMNALATDQAQRLASYVSQHDVLHGVTAGLYLGGDGSVERMRHDAVIDNRAALRASPPDILLTNYKMLDLLLQRRKDRDLWAPNAPHTLRYVVLDELHTYDGAQGSDVAMLLRRLGSRLQMARPDRPLGDVVPVATSATLGVEGDGAKRLREFAEKIFGRPFEEAAVIREERQSVEEACRRIVDGVRTSDVDFDLPIPDAAEVAACDAEDLDAIAALFTGRERLSQVELGQLLLGHTLTRGVLSATAGGHAHLERVVDHVIGRAPTWGKLAQADTPEVAEALARFLALLSLARRPATANDGQDNPLFAVDVQLWVREVSRLLRDITHEPAFRWADAEPIGAERQEVTALPAVYCRYCGRTGWQTVTSDRDPHAYDHRPARIYQATVHHSRLARALIRADDREPGVRFLNPSGLRSETNPDPDRIPVLVTANEIEARNGTCPSCGSQDAIRYLGSRVASLASVSISQLFASPHVERHEQKLLAFTDSVQDAAHRSGFFVGRTYRFNLRSVLAGMVVAEGEIRLHDLASSVLARADAHRDPKAARHVLVPPDLLYDQAVRSVWSDDPDPAGLETLTDRLAFEAHLELGLWSRFGRTLELTRSVTVSTDLPDFGHVVEVVDEVRSHIGILDTGDAEVFVLGLLERLRTRGAIWHDWLDAYADHDGALWHIWGGRPAGMRPFVGGRSRPVFVTSAPSGSTPFDPIIPADATPTWLSDWATRTMGAEGRDAAELVRRTLVLLSDQGGPLHVRRSRSGASIFGLDPAHLIVHDVPDGTFGVAASIVTCGVCAHQRAVPTHDWERILSSPCLRYRCPGRYEELPPGEGQLYYRDLYRSGELRRVVAAPHTGVLERDEREELERAFKAGDAPDAPNVLTCTSTLELGIDVGDLSALLLTSVPLSVASYRQRVGRAGRRSGNALVTTFASTDPKSLYYLEQPRHMLTGPVTAPDCYLEAIEILRRQFLAYLIDRAAEGRTDAGPEPRLVSRLVDSLDEPEGWMRLVVDSASDNIDAFLDLFGDRLTDETRHDLRDFATGRVEIAAKDAFDLWRRNYRELERRRDLMKRRIEDAEERVVSEPELEQTLVSLRGERRAIVGQLQDARRENPFSALARVGLTPNYTLYDDTVTLQASLWRRVDDGYETKRYAFSRPAMSAITEFAPGNAYYVGGFRLVIDGLDLGSTQQPTSEELRACPECAFITGDSTVTTCPRCQTGAIADAGAAHRVLRPGVVHCQDSEERARAFDERDERERVPYEIVASVDVDPPDIVQAHRHRHRTFGTELLRSAAIRHVNLGRTEHAGERVRIAGQERQAARFLTCRHCGVVDGAQEGQKGEPVHRGWCKTRSGAASESWEPLILMHELRTEAIRLLLPVTTFEVLPRLISFKAALLLGLRQSFGGDPEHLKVMVADFPAHGDTRRRFLVLYDQVPGGTGYLARLADPDRLRALLVDAQETIATCPCRDEGRPACHRCLLGVVPSREVDDVHRGHALDLLDEVLGDWEMEPVASVSDIPVDVVEESELERLFRTGVTAWAEANDSIELAAAPGQGTDAFELRFQRGPDTIRWLVRSQVDLRTDPRTRPDFLLTRQDDHAPDIAVYTDGYAYHANPNRYRVDDDAVKRAAVRNSGRLVWSLTYRDVTRFHEASVEAAGRAPTEIEVLSAELRSKVQQLHHHRRLTDPRVGDDGPGVDDVDANPVMQLLSFMSRPDVDAWCELATSVVAATLANSDQVSSSAVAEVVRVALRGESRPALEADTRQVDRTARAGGGCRWALLPVVGWDALVLLDEQPPHDANALRVTALAVLPDAVSRRELQDFEEMWAAWLHLANLLQFLQAGGAPGRDALIQTTTSAQSIEPADLRVVPSPDRPRAQPVAFGDSETLPSELEDELDLILDDEARRLARAAILHGAGMPEIGYEMSGWPLEVAWPDAKIAVLIEDDEDAAMRADLDAEGWEARLASEWDADGLIAALGGT